MTTHDVDADARSSAISRRTALGGLGASVAAVTGAAALGIPGMARAATSDQDPDPRPGSQALEQFFDGLFAAKSAHSPDRTMAYFDRKTTIYTDGVLGWQFPNWAALKALFEQYMPSWPAQARSYATDINGDMNGAVVRFTNTPEEFGAEIRGIAVVDIRDGKIVRWVDYWDGRHFGIPATDRLRTPAPSFPTQFGEQIVGNHASPRLTKTAAALAAALATGDQQDIAALFSADAVVEDLSLHTEVVGVQSVSTYLARAAATLPYGAGATIRHSVGGDSGGGYEWINTGGQVPRGVSPVTLDRHGLITRLTSIWDGSLVTSDWLQKSAALTTES